MCNQSGNTAYEGYGVIPKVLWGNRQFHRIRNATSRLMYIYLRTGPEFSPSGLFTIDEMSLAFSSCCEIGEVGVYMRPLIDIGLLKWDGQTVWLLGVREHFVKTASTDQMERIDRDVARVLETPVQKMYVEEFGINPYVNLETDAMEVAVAKVIGRTVELFDWKEKGVCRDLARAGLTAEDVTAVFSQPDGAWYKHDWRGQKGQRPTFTDVRKHLEPLLKFVDVEPEVKYQVDRDRLQRMLEGLIRANKGMGFAKATVIDEFGEPIWLKLMYINSWREWVALDTKRIKWAIVEALA